MQCLSYGHTPRRGVASVMAMVFMVVFSALALGFYAATTTASQVAGNERRSMSAQSAAESGIQFLRYHLSALDIPPGLTNDQLFDEVHMQLESRLDGTTNMNGGTIGYDGTSILMPATGYMKLDAKGEQQVKIVITRAGDQLISRITGRNGGVSVGRAIELKFSKAKNASAIFNFGVASRGPVSTTGNSTITGLTDKTKGSILSTSTVSNPVQVFGKMVSGDISVVNPNAVVKYGANVSIGDTTNHQLIDAYHIHKGVPEPKFPYIDTNVYAQYATNTYTSGMTVLENVRIPAGTNPTFSGNVVIRGVLLVEGSNKVSFGGNVDIQGVIVSSNSSPQPLISSGEVTNNVIEFTGSVTARPMDDPKSPLVGTQFNEVKKLKGAFIIAPQYRVKMWGNFATVGGSVVAAQFQMGGSAEGTIAGSVIQMRDDVATTIDGSADVVIASTGTTDYPPGISFGEYYTPVPGSYLEVHAD
jgi:hypothetical protein